MSQQYYRVKVRWPVPHCPESLFAGDEHTVHGIYDHRFYTTATDLRSVYLDIQSHLAKNYAPEGLNEGEDFGIDPVDPTMVLQTYNYMQPVIDFEVEVISDPEQVELIRQGLELTNRLKSLLSFIWQGLIPTRGDIQTAQFLYGETAHNLDCTIQKILQWYSYDDDDLFEQLRDMVDRANTQFVELFAYTREVILKGKAVS